jgi:enoyl-CoA hydratase/carnithine racemase
MTAETTDVRWDMDGAVAVVRLARPDKGNALSDRLVRELVAVLVEADRRPDVGAIVLEGEGRHFCAGGDLNDFLAAQARPLEDGYEEIAPAMELFRLGFSLRTPVVAAVQGASRGGGVGLVALAHLAVADPGATFALPEVRLGLFPYAIFPLLARAMGPRRSLELALTGRSFGAEEALAWGLVHAVSDQPHEEVRRWAEVLASRSRVAVRTGLEAFGRLTDPGAWPFDYLGLLRLLAFKSEALGAGVRQALDHGPGADGGRG